MARNAGGIDLRGPRDRAGTGCRRGQDEQQAWDKSQLNIPAATT
jgi:hypothetical protein